MPAESVRGAMTVELSRAIEDARAKGMTVLPEHAAKAVLRSAGVDVPRGLILHGPDDISALDGLRAPFVLKAVSPTLVHKSDAGGVETGISSAHDVARLMEPMRSRLAEGGHDLDGFLVEEMAPSGVEVVVGAVRSSGIGWAVMVGLGGVFVEVLQDVAFGLVPLARHDIRDMLDELRGKPLLEGARGRPTIDLDALVDVIHILAGVDGLLSTMPQDIVEIDLNPVLASPSAAVAVDARFVLGPSGASAAPGAHDERPATDFGPLMAPRTVAVIGATSRGSNVANLFLRNLRDFGFRGEIVPVHPTASDIEGLSAVSSLSDLTVDVDYAYVALPAARVAEALSTANGRVRFAQVVSSGFGETSEGVELERRLLEVARSAGIRVLGPNCIGTHSTIGRLTFVDRAPGTPGPVTVISQSGGLSVDVLRLGDHRGVRFRSVISMGNGADVKPAELLEFFLDDPDTEVIGLYLESLAAGREVLDVLRAAGVRKPVVLLAGGRTDDGSRAAQTHTGALTGNHRLWPALARQAGVVLVDTLHDFVNALLALQMRDPDADLTTGDVVLFGNGGGTSVLAADALERAGLRTPRLSDAAIAELNALGLPPGNGLANPIDAPAGTLAVGDGSVAEEILSIVLAHSSPSTIISHINVGVISSNTTTASRDVVESLIEAIVRARDNAVRRPQHLLVLRSDGSVHTEAQIAAYEQIARSHGLPVYRELTEAAVAARCLIDDHRLRRRANSPSHV